ncbi:MAG: tryptophan 2,3-dioxygenase [Candidatus Xenobia bacterium]
MERQYSIGHPEDGGPKVLAPQELTYSSYLKVPSLLQLQELLSEPPDHDEMLFIIIHQTYELWFKQIIHELEAALKAMQEGRILETHHFVRRIVRIMHVLVQQIHVLETMATVEFLQFRDRLNPASGFQSVQFREIEFMGGLKSERYLSVFEHHTDSQAALKARLEGPDLWQAFSRLLGIESGAEKQAALDAVVALYQRPEANLPLFLLAESLMDFDEALILWRSHHVMMVERVIGMRPGTGGSAGVGYLESTRSKRCFPLLWEARTYLRKNA